MCTGGEIDAGSSGVCPAVRSQTNLRIIFFDRKQNRDLVCCSVQCLEDTGQEIARGLSMAVGYDGKAVPFACGKNEIMVDT